MTGTVCMAVAAFLSCSVIAGEGKGEAKQDREKKQDREEARKHGGGKGDRRDSRPSIEDMDKDGDGKVTLEEFTDAHLARIKEMFDRLDANKDGVISKEDREARLSECDTERKGKQDKED